MSQTGGVLGVTVLDTLDISTSGVLSVSTDGQGKDCTLRIVNGVLEIVDHGNGYKIHDILMFSIGENTYCAKK